MYGGSTLQQNRATGMNSASPIPQQWWDQDGGGPPPGARGGSAMDAAAHRNYRAASPNLSQRFEGMNPGGAPPSQGHNYGQYNPNSDPNMNGGHGPRTPVGGNVPPPPPPQKGPAANGLIRLALKKPMGIVFEPMEDPHNPSQQRGVRICDLPRTGAAALSGMLEVGDELLSINNKPMSRLTFDEIMDFIIEADVDSVDLLFRRPKKEKGGKVPEGMKNSSTVKWDANIAPALVMVADDTRTEEGTVEDSPRRKAKGKNGSPPRNNKVDPRDEESLYSGDETFYTEQTDYTEDTRDNKRRGKRGTRRYESESFLDMLIDTVCAPVMGERDKRGGGGDDSDDDMTFNSMDDTTYASGDDDTYLEQKKKKWQQSRKKRSEEDKKSAEEETKKKSEKKQPAKSKSKSKPKFDPEEEPTYDPEPDGPPMGDIQTNPYGNDQVAYVEPHLPEILGMPDSHDAHQPVKPPSPPKSPPRRTSGSNRGGGAMPSSPRRGANNATKNSPRRGSPRKTDPPPSNHFVPQPAPHQFEAIDPMAQDPKMPFQEIIYDDQVDGVSVMESVGGPSLLLENLRNVEQIKRTVDRDLINNFGKDFKPDLGLTREESIQMNPERFYKHVVKKMLEQCEPEKVRLMDKLFDKYRGREEHLIHKLSARYVHNPNDQKSESVGKKISADSSDGDYDGFKAFGGGDFSKSTSGDKSDPPEAFARNAWQPPAVQEFQRPEEAPEKNGFNERFEEQHEDDHSSYTESDYDSLDGTSPEVIAQVSELLNYVYGKTTVAGQIDRVSTIMRAYEGREAVLLELLETKALLKANNDNGGLQDLPESIRDNPALQQQNPAEVQIRRGNQEMVSPISNMTGPSSTSVRKPKPAHPVPSISHSDSSSNNNPFHIDNPKSSNQQFGSQDQHGDPFGEKKKKKGLFGGMFKKNNKATKAGGGAFPTSDNGKRKKKGALLGSE